MHIYVITNTVNGKIYVGQTSKDNLNRYFRQKMSDAITRSKVRTIPLYNAFRKYGANASMSKLANQTRWNKVGGNPSPS